MSTFFKENSRNVGHTNQTGKHQNSVQPCNQILYQRPLQLPKPTDVPLTESTQSNHSYTLWNKPNTLENKIPLSNTDEQITSQVKGILDTMMNVII